MRLSLYAWVVILGSSYGFSGFFSESCSGFTLPVEYSANDACTESSGDIAVACTRSGEGVRSSGVIFTTGDSPDTIFIDHRRIHGIVSICSSPGGGYLVTGPADPNFTDTAVARIADDGAVLWLLVMDGPGNQAENQWKVCSGTPGGGAAISAGPAMGYIDGTGSLLWTASSGSETCVNAASADSSGIVFAGEKPGFEHTCAFASRYDLAGELIWTRDFDLGGYGEFLGISPVEGGYLFTGSQWSCTSPRSGLLVRTDSAGDEPFVAIAPAPPGYQQAYIESTTPLVTGETAGLGYAVRSGSTGGCSDALIALFDSSCFFTESWCYSDGENSSLEFTGICVDSSGVATLAGLNRSPGEETLCFSVVLE